MAQWMRKFVNMKYDRLMPGPANGYSLFKSLDHTRIVPPLARIYFTTRSVFIGFKPLQGLGYAAFGCLQINRHTDSITIVPNGHGQRNLKHTGRIDGFEKHPFGGTGFSY